MSIFKNIDFIFDFINNPVELFIDIGEPLLISIVNTFYIIFKCYYIPYSLDQIIKLISINLNKDKLKLDKLLIIYQAKEIYIKYVGKYLISTIIIISFNILYLSYFIKINYNNYFLKYIITFQCLLLFYITNINLSSIEYNLSIDDISDWYVIILFTYPSIKMNNYIKNNINFNNLKIINWSDIEGSLLYLNLFFIILCILYILYLLNYTYNCSSQNKYYPLSFIIITGKYYILYIYNNILNNIIIILVNEYIKKNYPIKINIIKLKIEIINISIPNILMTFKSLGNIIYSKITFSNEHIHDIYFIRNDKLIYKNYDLIQNFINCKKEKLILTLIITNNSYWFIINLDNL